MGHRHTGNASLPVHTHHTIANYIINFICHSNSIMVFAFLARKATRPLTGAAAGLGRMLIAMTIPLTGTQYEIEAGDYRATVTELGAGLRGLLFGDAHLITGFDADEL